MGLFLWGKRERINAQRDSQEEIKEVARFISFNMAVFYCGDK